VRAGGYFAECRQKVGTRWVNEPTAGSLRSVRAI
jgi:hypothetical protein